MANETARAQIADRWLRTVDGLASVSGFGLATSVLVEFETAPVAIVRSAEGTGRLIIGRSPAHAAKVLLEARRLRAPSPPEGTAHPLEMATGDLATGEMVTSQIATGEMVTGDLEVARALIEPAGQVVTARVELVRGGRRVVATSTGRNAGERGLYLMAEAAARAVTQFLPPGYGVILGEIQPAPGEFGEVLKAAVLFLTPTEDRPLEGVVPVDGSPEAAAVRTVLAAVHDHVKPLLA